MTFLPHLRQQIHNKSWLRWFYVLSLLSATLLRTCKQFSHLVATVSSLHDGCVLETATHFYTDIAVFVFISWPDLNWLGVLLLQNNWRLWALKRLSLGRARIGLEGIRRAFISRSQRLLRCSFRYGAVPPGRAQFSLNLRSRALWAAWTLNWPQGAIIGWFCERGALFAMQVL